LELAYSGLHQCLAGFIQAQYLQALTDLILALLAKSVPATLLSWCN